MLEKQLSLKITEKAFKILKLEAVETDCKMGEALSKILEDFPSKCTQDTNLTQTIA